MNAKSSRMEFAPPPTPGLVRALTLAIVAHALLMAVLTVGVQWKHDPTPVTVEAELWSALPIEAAPRAPDPEPVSPEPVQPPVAKEVVSPPKPVTVIPDPSIAIAKEKDRLHKEKQLEQDRLELEKRQKDALKA
jgi:colicin import membrane protein